jgi:hypothetical protein
MSSSLNKRKNGILRRTFRRIGKDFGIIKRNKKTNNLSQSTPSQSTPSQSTPSQSTPSQSTVTKNVGHYTTDAELATLLQNIPDVPKGEPLKFPDVPKGDSHTSNIPNKMTGEQHNNLWLSIQNNSQLNMKEKKAAQKALVQLNRHLFPKKGGKTKKKKQKKRRTYKR